MRALFVDQHPLVGIVPGPGRLAMRGDRLWLAGGARGDSRLWRYRDDWRALSIDAHGLRDVLVIDDDTCVVCGEYGYLAVVRGDAIEKITTDTRDCLFTLARGADGTIWVGGDATLLRMQLGDRTTSALATGTRIARIAFAPDDTMWLATAAGLARLDGATLTIEHATPAPLTDLAFGPDGTLAASGDAGQLIVDGRRIEAPAIDLECVIHDGGFVVTGQDGYVGRFADGVLRQIATADPAYRITSAVGYRGGLLCAGWIQYGPPVRLRGALYWEGDGTPPDRVYEPPRQPLPPRRARSFVPREPAVTLDSAVELSVADAEARMPEVSWPDTQLTRVRFVDGSLHLADSEALLEASEDIAIAVRGDLVIDGVLDAVAGGDGYDSVLVVGGNVWCEAAIFAYGMKASIGGALEAASVVACSHGDDGGTLWAKTLRAQVLAYAQYFPKPDADLEDTFLIGDDNDASFPLTRANEVFVTDVLDGDGLDLRALHRALREAKRVVR